MMAATVSAHPDPWSMTVHLSGPAAFDAIEVRRALAILVEPGTCHELRGLPSGRSLLICGDDLDAAVERAGQLADDRGVYVTLNPVRHDLGDRAARNADILCRRWFLIDCDPVKADPDGNATDEEKKAAGQLLLTVRGALDARGWPAPLIVDSGNGFHLLYRVDLPNDPLAKAWLAGCLKALATLYDTDLAKIDRKVHNSARITKLPGTWARKGPDTLERPHRLAEILEVPETLQPISNEFLASLAGLVARPANGAAADAVWTIPVGGDNGEAYARAALEREVGKVAGAVPGDRHEQLVKSATKLGGYITGGYLDRAEVERQLAAAARGAGLDEDDIQRTTRDQLNFGGETPKTVPTDRAKGKARAKPKAPEGRLTIRGSEVVPKKVEWLWPDRVPIGFLTVFAGRTGVGKSFVTCHAAAAITRGGILPGGHDLAGEVGSVLIISEDPQDTMLAPRLIEMGADMGEIYFMTWNAMASYALEDIAMLERAAMEGGRLPRLIVIDPPTNFLGEKDEHKNAEVRQTLMHLVAWLQDKAVACILILHVNKQTGKDIEAINRVMGSVAWVSTSRIAHVFAPDPDNADQCLFACPKNNLGPCAKALAYRIEKTDTLAKVEWLGEVDTTADEAMGGQRRQPRRVVAAQFLLERFRLRREWDSTELVRDAAEHAISRNALFEAKGLLPITARQHARQDGSRYWAWNADEGWPPPEKAKEGG